MDELLITISNTFGLTQTMSFIDLGVVAASAALTIITGYNFLSSPDTEEEQIEVKAVEPASKTKAELHSPTATEITWENRLFKGLSKTRADIWGKVGRLLGAAELDQDVIDELEETLFTSDLSPRIVEELIDHIKSIHKPDVESTQDYLVEIKDFLKAKMAPAQEKVNTELYKFEENKTQGLKVIMIVGVNGAGKTTTIGKLATKLRSQGANVVVGACDTFRAAAVEQLEVWCKRADVEIVKAAEGADPSGVAFDTVKKAKESGADYCIIDTAGRLHTKSNLMDELIKTKKVMGKVMDTAPHETLLVVDAITGQNAMRQAEEFNKSLDLTGLIFTKCDGSSKAGSAVGIVENLQVPIAYIGVGEDVEDLDIFKLDSFLNALLGIES